MSSIIDDLPPVLGIELAREHPKYIARWVVQPKYVLDPTRRLGEQFRLFAQRLMDQFPRIEKVVGKNRTSISASHNQIQGKMWNGQEYIKTEILNITHVIDRVGTGDAFASGLIYGLLHYDDIQALKFAAAACALKHTVPGDVNMVSLEHVLRLMEGNTSGAIRR